MDSNEEDDDDQEKEVNQGGSLSHNLLCFNLIEYRCLRIRLR